MLIAGGDVSGLLGGVVNLATSTNSTTASEIYEPVADAYMVVGPLNGSREAASAAVVLPNQKVLIAGGSHCYATTVNNPKTIVGTATITATGATEVGTVVTITTAAAQPNPETR